MLSNVTMMKVAAWTTGVKELLHHYSILAQEKIFVALRLILVLEALYGIPNQDNQTSVVFTLLMISLLVLQDQQSHVNAAIWVLLRSTLIQRLSAAYLDMLLEEDSVIELSVLVKVAVTSIAVMSLTTSCT